MRDLNEILAEVRSKIAAACARAGRDPAEVEIVAVTKTHGAEVVKEAWDAGLTIVGENKVQEAAWKKPASVTGPSWHLIGHLQGMSGDYEVAVEEGATWLRLGTALFGERPKVKAVRAAADDPDAVASAGLDSYSGAWPRSRGGRSSSRPTVRTRCRFPRADS